MREPAIVAGYRRALARSGVPVTVTRINGQAPAAVSFSVNVSAIVRDYSPDTTVVERTGYPASKPGALTQGDRLVILMAEDLRQQAFPLPVKKNDQITIVDPVSLQPIDVLNVVEVDPLKRGIAVAIELKAAGVS